MDEQELDTPFLPDAYSSSGRTPLMVASASGNEEIVRSEARDSEDLCVFFTASLFRTLIEHGTDVNLPLAITERYNPMAAIIPHEEDVSVWSLAN